MERFFLFFLVILGVSGCFIVGKTFEVKRLNGSVVTIYAADPHTGEVYQGRGFAVKDDTVVTNLHVVYEKCKDREMPVIVVSQEGIFYGEIIYCDPVRDIAALAVKGHPFKPLKFSKRLKKGEEVFIVDNSGEGISILRGEILNLLGYDELIQTDLAVNKGNSGSPLFNMKGEVIGIITFHIQGEERNSFAISARYILESLKGLQKEGQR